VLSSTRHRSVGRVVGVFKTGLVGGVEIGISLISTFKAIGHNVRPPMMTPTLSIVDPGASSITVTGTALMWWKRDWGVDLDPISKPLGHVESTL
jgi:hypothetical protein